MVLKVDLHDFKDKQKAMKAVATFSGIDSISVDDNKMTVIGDADPVEIAVKLRKLYQTDIETVGPVEEPEKKKEEEPKKEEEKKEGPSEPIGYEPWNHPYWAPHHHVNVFTIEEYPNPCVIC